MRWWLTIVLTAEALLACHTSHEPDVQRPSVETDARPPTVEPGAVASAPDAGSTVDVERAKRLAEALSRAAALYDGDCEAVASALDASGAAALKAIRDEQGADAERGLQSLPEESVKAAQALGTIANVTMRCRAKPTFRTAHQRLFP
jgi:hypothetical protein